MARKLQWRQAREILCIRLDSIGDVLMTTPAIRALKENGRNRRITLLTSSAGAEIAGLVPEIDEVLVYDAPWLKATPPRKDAAEERRMIDLLAERKFDAAVIFTVYSQNPLPSALLAFIADIPLRLAHSHENPYQLLTDWVADPEPAALVRHEVRRQLDLVASVGCMTEDESLSIRVPREAKQRVSLLLDALGLDPRRRTAVVHAGASASSRRYPPAAFAEVASRLALEDDWQIVLSGTAQEKRYADELIAQAKAPIVSLVGRFDLGELAALLSMADLLVTNNTGPAHVAAAVGTPVVDLYALTNPQHTPWAVPNRVLSHDVECKYCYRSVCPEGTNDCLALVEPAEVVAATRDLMAETNAPLQDVVALA